MLNLVLALIGATALAVASNLPDPLMLPKKCGLQKGDALYGVGFPSTSTRAKWRHPPESDVNVVQKRWSQGVYSGLLKLTEVTEPFFGSTVDAYYASEEPVHLGWHSLGPRCETMLRIGAALITSN